MWGRGRTSSCFDGFCDVYDFASMRHNIDIKKALNRHPKLLSMATITLDERVEYLKILMGERRLQHDIGSSLALLAYAPTWLDRNLVMPTSLGLDAKMMVKRYPLTLTHSEEAIRTRITFFKESGLDPIRIINAVPHVTGYNVQRKLRPIVEFITEEMGRSLEEITHCPRCFSVSLTDRLSPRYKYLILHGRRNDYSLNSICSTTDDRFASLTGQTPDHYRQWLTGRNQ